jgi:bifunctional non-homologous end joining protein LigD
VALKTYRDKRNFTRSPEPAGDDAVVRARQGKGREPRFFCVQKHLATALHYDFRIEHNGVLLSWAVPKGPSINPADKRLAMHVEDHPIEYGEFEGVIPEGYGAGVVMLWDRGTWTPEVDDVDAALAKGDLKMTLEGFKLKGSWVLVRTKGWGARRPGEKPAEDGKSWLLIKHKDDWAGPIDIASFAPNSVKSGGTFRDILLQEAPDVWQSHRPGAGAGGDAALRKIAEKVAALEEATEATPELKSTPEANQAAPPKAKTTPASPAKKAAAKKAATGRAAAPTPRAAKARAAKARTAKAEPKA